MSELKLQFGIQFDDLYKAEGLQKVHQGFLDFLGNRDSALLRGYLDASQNPPKGQALSSLCLSIAPVMADFIAILFNESRDSRDIQDFKTLYDCKRLFVQRRVLKTNIEDKSVPSTPPSPFLALTEVEFAQSVMDILNTLPLNVGALKPFESFIRWGMGTSSGRAHTKGWLITNLPQPQIFDDLIANSLCDGNSITSTKLQQRTGFDLTDPGLTPREAHDQAQYCIQCHKQQKDSCSTGLKDQKTQETQKNPLGVLLEGCPLDQKISEMHTLKSQGLDLAALCVITIDNPFVAATGHRICNACSKACIFQKQSPVDTPGVETQILKSVLNQPWGVEIYSLLTRWNPLRFEQPILRASSHKKVLVVGQGPAGFTLAQYLLNEGHTVVGIDCQKTDPLTIPFTPIHSLDDISYPLSQRLFQGFGGVMEYGITARWDKNFLTILQLILQRHANYRLFDGVKYGSSLDYQCAKELGFDYIAHCTGSPPPHLPRIPNAFAKGCRLASDFLMALNLSDAKDLKGLCNLQLRFPALVIGGGLTAIDTATELLAYYPHFLKKFKNMYAGLVQEKGEAFIQELLTSQEYDQAQVFLTHAQELEHKDILPCLKEWGGVTVIYRGKISDSPAYRLNHQEISHALAEGIEIIQNTTPLQVLVDEESWVKGLEVQQENDIREIPAQSIFFALGNQRLSEEKFPKKDEGFFGDVDPKYAGSVVHAMASAKHGYKKVSKFLEANSAPSEHHGFWNSLAERFLSTVKEINPLAKNVHEIVIQSPNAVEHFQPGQFFKLQNYGSMGDVTLMEPLALTGAWVDPTSNTLGLISLDFGASSHISKTLKPGERIFLMGPLGVPTHIPKNQKVLLIGGGLGNAVLFSIAEAMHKAGCEVIVIAGYKSKDHVFYAEKIEEFSDQVIWTCEEGEPIPTHRPQDLSLKGRVTDVWDQDLSFVFDWKKAAHLMTIGSAAMMKAVQEKFNHQKSLQQSCSLNSPMQCMAGGICGQCVQRIQINDQQAEILVFSCIEQDQKLQYIDFKFLNSRLNQQSLCEKLVATQIQDLEIIPRKSLKTIES